MVLGTADVNFKSFEASGCAPSKYARVVFDFAMEEGVLFEDLDVLADVSCSLAVVEIRSASGLVVRSGM